MERITTMKTISRVSTMKTIRFVGAVALASVLAVSTGTVAAPRDDAPEPEAKKVITPYIVGGLSLLAGGLYINDKEVEEEAAVAGPFTAVDDGGGGRANVFLRNITLKQAVAAQNWTCEMNGHTYTVGVNRANGNGVLADIQFVESPRGRVSGNIKLRITEANSGTAELTSSGQPSIPVPNQTVSYNSARGDIEHQLQKLPDHGNVVEDDAFDTLGLELKKPFHINGGSCELKPE
jgi:hypothetical protein